MTFIGRSGLEEWIFTAIAHNHCKNGLERRVAIWYDKQRNKRNWHSAHIFRYYRGLVDVKKSCAPFVPPREQAGKQAMGSGIRQFPVRTEDVM